MPINVYKCLSGMYWVVSNMLSTNGPSGPDCRSSQTLALLSPRNARDISVLCAHVSDCCLSQDVRESVFGKFPWKCWFYTINEAHKQYSLLDTMLNYILYFGPPGKHLSSSPQNPLHVGRRSRPTCSRFSWLFYRCLHGGPRWKI